MSPQSLYTNRFPALGERVWDELSARTPILKVRDLGDYEMLVGKILGLNTEGYPDSQTAQCLTEEGFHSARGQESVGEVPH